MDTILIRCWLAVYNFHFGFAQDAGGGSGLGDVQRTIKSALYSPAEQGTWLPEAFDVVHGCEEVAKFVERRCYGCGDCAIVHANDHEFGCCGGDFVESTCVFL